jgi:hypothetical protein
VKYHRSTGLVTLDPRLRKIVGLYRVLATAKRSSGVNPDTGQVKTPGRNGHLSYIKASQEGLRTAAIYDDYPKVQVSKEKFIDIHLAIDGLVVGLLRRSSLPSSSEPTDHPPHLEPRLK